MKLLTAALFFVVLATSDFAQTDPQTGFPLYGSFETGNPDSTNRYNLNSNISFPVVSGKDRGGSFNFSLSYNSLIWELSANGQAWQKAPSPDTSGLSSPGWSFTNYFGIVEYRTTANLCPGTPTTYSDFAFVEPDGTRHPFAVNYVQACAGGLTGTLTGYATDSSGYFFNANTFIAYGPDGRQISASLKDTNGNYLVNSGTDVYDTTGHDALHITQTSSSIKYQYQDTTGTQRAVTVAFTNYNIKTDFACSGVSEFSGTNYLPSSITYPNGVSYSFTYEPTPNNSGYVTGRVSKITLPNGGYVQYQYTGSNDGINCADGTILNLTRTVYDGTNSYVWTFGRLYSGFSSIWYTTVTYPQMPYNSAANQSVFTFNTSGQEQNALIDQGAATLRNIVTSWAANGSPATKTTTLEDGSTQSEIETSYDSYGNLLSLKEHDYGTGAPGSVLRTTTNTYLSTTAYTNLNIMNRVTKKTIADSTGTIQYRIDTAYDGTTISPCPTGVVNHDDTNYACTFTTRGNPTSSTTYINASAGSGAESKKSYYDVFGNLVQADMDCCDSKTWTYSSTTTYSYPDSVTNGASGGPQTTTSFTYDPYAGLLATSTDSNNQLSSYSFDEMRRPLSITRPDQAQFTYVYNDTQHTVTKGNPIQGSNIEETTNYLDGLGRSVKTVIADASGTTYSILQRVFDPVGRLYQTANPHNSTAQYWTTQQYDAIGRNTKRILQDNSNESYSYSVNFTTKTDPAGHQRKFQLDGLGRTSSVYEPDPTNGNSLTLQTAYTFSVLGPPLTVTQGVQTRTSVLDGMRRLTSETTPEAGTVTYQYNTFDQVSKRTDAKGVITSYTYDTLNRPHTVTYNVGTTGVPATGSITYTYGTSATQFNNGRLLTTSDGSGSETYSYDLLGRVIQDQQIISGTTYTIGYQYNLAGRITSLTYPSQRVVQQNYDTVGRPSSIVNGSTTYASGITFDPNFRMSGFSYGNGITTSVGFSPDRLQFSSVSYVKSGQTLYGLSAYSYAQNGGNNGEITSITDSVDSGRSISYTYDSLDRVSSALTSGSTNYPQWGLSWTYDRYGNRTAQTVTAGTAVANSVVVNSATNQITTAGYSYDTNGNMTNDGDNALVYDAENRIVSAADGSGTATYTYRAAGLRAQKVLNGVTTNYVYIGNQLLAEYANGVLTEEYIYLGKALIASYDSSTLYYHHNDHLSVRMTTDASGNVVGQQGHYTFGEDWYMASKTVDRHFTSYYRDSESSNDYAFHRYHVNRLGRFSSADPAKGCALKPQLSNRYSYVGNDPVDHVDPNGLFLEGGCDPWDGCVNGCGDFDDCPSPCGWGCGCETPTFGCPVYPTCPTDSPAGSCTGTQEPVPPPPPKPATQILRLKSATCSTSSLGASLKCSFSNSDGSCTINATSTTDKCYDSQHGVSRSGEVLACCPLLEAGADCQALPGSNAFCGSSGGVVPGPKPGPVPVPPVLR